MVRRRVSPWWGFHFLFAFCLASCLSLFCYFCLVLASRVCVLVARIFVIMLTFHVYVCLGLCHQRGSFACLTVVVSTCLRLDVRPICMTPKIGECFAPRIQQNNTKPAESTTEHCPSRRTRGHHFGVQKPLLQIHTFIVCFLFKSLFVRSIVSLKSV